MHFTAAAFLRRNFILKKNSTINLKFHIILTFLPETFYLFYHPTPYQLPRESVNFNYHWICRCKCWKLFVLLCDWKPAEALQVTCCWALGDSGRLRGYSVCRGDPRTACWLGTGAISHWPARMATWCWGRRSRASPELYPCLPPDRTEWVKEVEKRFSSGKANHATSWTYSPQTQHLQGCRCPPDWSWRSRLSQPRWRRAGVDWPDCTQNMSQDSGSLESDSQSGLLVREADLWVMSSLLMLTSDWNTIVPWMMCMLVYKRLTLREFIWKIYVNGLNY